MTDIKVEFKRHKRISRRVNIENNSQVDEVKLVTEFVQFYNSPFISEKAKEIIRKEIQK